jgi:hypothetical protein
MSTAEKIRRQFILNQNNPKVETLFGSLNGKWRHLMRNFFLLSLSIVLSMSSMRAYAADTPKFSNDDLRRYDSDSQNVTRNPASKLDISGTWKYVCCIGKYWGEIDFAVDENNRIKGQLYDMAAKTGGAIEGTVKGNIVLFTRNKGEQDYKLNLNDDGTAMSGFFVGNHDGTVGTEVTLTRDKFK